MRNEIGNQWKEYKEQVLPKDASDVQVSECEMAFYAGARSIFGLIDKNLDDVSDEEGAAYLEGLHDELEEYLTGFLRRHVALLQVGRKT